MSVIIAVLKDLYQFVFSAIFRTRSTVNGVVHTTPEPLARQTLSAQPSRFRSTAEIIGPEINIGGEKNTIMYTGGSDIPLHREPTQTFDGIIRRLPFGAMLMLLENKGRWSRVVHTDLEGWILREDLVDRAAHIYPHLVIGERNDVDDLNTIRIRSLIADEYGAGAAELPLQAEEYVHYRLFRKGIKLPWSVARPRQAGVWHKLLKGQPGVYMGVRPKTGDVLEYELADGTGHVAYIEAVFPDHTINISETNYPEGGMYSERVMTHEEWRELRPVFISFA